MFNLVPIKDLQTGAKRVIESVKEDGGPVVITQRGRGAAVLLSLEEYEGLLHTLDEVSYPDWRDRLARAKEESARGEGMDFDQFIKGAQHDQGSHPSRRAKRVSRTAGQGKKKRSR